MDEAAFPKEENIQQYWDVYPTRQWAYIEWKKREELKSNFKLLECYTYVIGERQERHYYLSS